MKTTALKTLIGRMFPPRDRQKPFLDMRIRASVALGAMLLYWLAALFGETLSTAADDAVIKLILALMAGWLTFRLGYYFQNRSLAPLLFLAAAVCLGLWLRTQSLNVETLDYQDFLSRWVAGFRQDGWSAFQKDFAATYGANYNMPYLYMLAIIARLPLNDLYLIKLISIFFDCALVLASLRLAQHFRFSPLRAALLGTAVFLAPTVWLNSAYWAQCDVIYAFFVLTAVIYLLEKRPSLSFVMAALAFTFKLQTIFFLPCYLAFWITKRVRFKHFFFFPLVYILSVLPAWFLGQSWKQILGVYGGQAAVGEGILNFNSPSVYALVWAPEDYPHYDFLFTAGIVCAALLILSLCYLAWERRARLDARAVMVLSLAMVLGIPWFLPRMHERYFFLADIFFIFIAFMIPECWYFAPVGIFCSYAGYHAYMFVKYIPFIGVVVPAFLLMLMLGRTMILFWQVTAPPDVPPELPQKTEAVKRKR